MTWEFDYKFITVQKNPHPVVLNYSTSMDSYLNHKKKLNLFPGLISNVNLCSLFQSHFFHWFQGSDDDNALVLHPKLISNTIFTIIAHPCLVDEIMICINIIIIIIIAKY